MDKGMPPPEAYGRATNTERYRVLHRVADELLDELEATFEVERLEGPEVDRAIAGGRPVERCVRLVPVGDGAPLTIAFSDFPGLFVRYGRFLCTGLPACGCDACDEDPQALADELRTRATLLTLGGLREEIRPGDVQYYAFEGQGEAWGSPINPAYIDGPLDPVSLDWGAWRQRDRT